MPGGPRRLLDEGATTLNVRVNAATVKLFDDMSKRCGLSRSQLVRFVLERTTEQTFPAALFERNALGGGQ